MGGAVIIVIAIAKIAEQAEKSIFREGLQRLPRTLDPIGFVLFAGGVTMLLLALAWGGNGASWSSATIVGMLCGGFVTVFVFCVWVWRKGDEALIPPSSLLRRSVYTGCIVIFFQGGASQATPFFLPLWFQAIKGDDPSQSAIHLLPSLATVVVSLVLFGSLVRKLRYIPPWAIAGSLIASVGSGLCTTLAPNTSVGEWVGFQILASFGRGVALQAVRFNLCRFSPTFYHTI